MVNSTLLGFAINLIRFRRPIIVGEQNPYPVSFSRWGWQHYTRLQQPHFYSLSTAYPMRSKSNLPHLLRRNFMAKVIIPHSGGATGYAGYAPAYPAIPATEQVYIRIYTHIHSSAVVYESWAWLPERVLARATSEREAQAGTRPMRPATETGSRDNADANMELRIEAARRLDFECSPCPTPTSIQIVHANTVRVDLCIFMNQLTNCSN